MVIRSLLALCLLILTSCCNDDLLIQASQKIYSSSAKERNKGALDLAKCGTKASKSVDRLSQLLYDENIGVQSSAAYALRKIDTPEARKILERATARRSKHK